MTEITEEASRRAGERAEFIAHRDDCVAYRRVTEERFDRLDATLEDSARERRAQHQQGLAALRWQRGILITILLSLMGFMGSLAWTKVFH